MLNEELVEYTLEEHTNVISWPLGNGPAIRDWLQGRGIDG